MTTTARQGAPEFPIVLGSILPSTHEEMNAAIEELQTHRNEWVAFSISDRITLIDRLIRDFMTIVSRWVDVSIQTKGIAEDSLCVGEEWAAGAWPVLKNLRQLRQSLVDIETEGHPKIPGRVTTKPNGQVVAQVFPQTMYDRLFFERIKAESIPEYIDKAVDFANQHIWGSLNATIIVHPASLKDPGIASAVERAIGNLKYGTVGINIWAGAGFTFGTTSWGAFPGHELHDIQSGLGVVHNTLMFARPQKSVLWGPFRGVLTPPWFVTQGKIARKLFPKLVAFEAAPTPLRVPGIMSAALGM